MLIRRQVYRNTELQLHLSKHTHPRYQMSFAQILEQYIVGNKAKGQISKHRKQENKANQIFGKTEVCVSGGKKGLFLGKIGWLCSPVTSVLRFALLLCYQRFDVFTARS